MRTLQFRVWHEEYKEMIVLENSGLQYYDFEGGLSLGFTVDGYGGFWAHEQYESTTKKVANYPIMQMTPFEDIKDVNIYEKDILKTHHGDVYVCEWSDEEGGFVFRNIKTGLFINFSLVAKFEIIGNVYENPEKLLT